MKSQTANVAATTQQPVAGNLGDMALQQLEEVTLVYVINTWPGHKCHPF